jgi:hypothetical protein
MNLENTITQERENLLSTKNFRSIYQAEKNRNTRQKDIEEKRNKIEQMSLFHNKANAELMQRLEFTYKEISHSEKLKSSQNREIKALLSEIRKILGHDQKFFIWIAESNYLGPLIRVILETKSFPFDLKHEALWIVAISSTLKINADRAYQFMKSLVVLSEDIHQLSKSNQLIFLQKIVSSLTNFIIEKAELVTLVLSEKALQRTILLLLDDLDSKNVTLGLWFIRIVLKAGKSAFEDVLFEGLLQQSFINNLKKYAHEKDIITEILWTLAHISQINFEYEAIGIDLIVLVMEIAVYYDDSILLPSLTVLGNAFVSLQFSNISAILNRGELNSILEVGLTSNNFIIKRETMFLLSNMAAKSELSAEFILGKNDLVQFLFEVISNNEPYIFREGLHVIANLATISSSKYLGYFQENYSQLVSKTQNALAIHQSSEEIQELQKKLIGLFFNK